MEATCTQKVLHQQPQKPYSVEAGRAATKVRRSSTPTEPQLKNFWILLQPGEQMNKLPGLMMDGRSSIPFQSQTVCGRIAIVQNAAIHLDRSR